MAVVRSSGTLKFYVNGVGDAGQSFNLTNSSGNVEIGRNPTYSSESYLGYLQDLKIYKGFAKYTANFTPPQPICGFTTDISTQTGFTTTTATGALLSSVVGLGSTSTLAFSADQNLAGVTSITSSSGITTLPDPYAQNLVLALPLADITGVGNSFTNDRNTQIRSVSLVGGGSTKTITNNNNVSLATTNKWYGGSAYFNGLNAYLKTSTSEVFTGDFTIECWLNSSSTSTGNIIGDYPGTNSFQLVYGGNGYQNIGFYRATSVVSLYPSNSAALRNTWNHIAAVRKDSTLYLFANGILQGSTTLTGNVGVGNGWYIGVDSDGTSEDLTGYINDLRVYNGVAKYTTNFTPPPPMFGDYTRSTPNKVIFTPASDYVLEAKNTSGIITSSYSATRQWGTKPKGGIYDPYASNLVLAIPGGAVGGATSTFDVTGQIKFETPTASYVNAGIVTYSNSLGIGTYQNKSVTNTNVSISSTITKYYSRSMQSTSSGRLTIPTSTDLNLTGDFTIEMWFYATSSSTLQTPLNISANGSNSAESGIWISRNATNSIDFYHNGSLIVSTGSNAINSNQWYHCAFTRNGNVTAVFLDGILRATSTTSYTVTVNQNYYIGDRPAGAVNANYPFSGYITDFRVYNGVAKYTSNFTPPNQIYLT